MYLADRRYDMLPPVLSTDLCSLISNVDRLSFFDGTKQEITECLICGLASRYAVSVLWELNTSTYEVKHVWYGRTVICSAYKLFYEAAQDIVENKKSSKELISLIPELDVINPAECQERCCHLRGNGVITLLTVVFRLVALRWAIYKLTEIARVLRERRDEGGALELEGIEVRVQIGEEKAVEDLVPKQVW